MPRNAPPGMLSYVLEILSEIHDRAGFDSGLESVDRYLKDNARSRIPTCGSTA